MTSLDLLVLGGTSWLGGAVAADALARGHRVTCLARGDSGTPPTGVEWVRGDRWRPDAYDQVAERDWDAVVDVSWQPELVRSALDRLSAHVGHWVYVSSGSVYRDDATPDTDETAPLHPPHTEPGPVDAEAYGPAKVACEEACRRARGDDGVLLARIGLIAGYGDRSDRFGYWPGRFARAEDAEVVLAPPGDTPLQVVDVLDVAALLVTAAERRVAGPVNVVGDPGTVGDVLAACLAVSGRPVVVEEAGHTWLSEHGVAPWAGPDSLPLWLPQPEYAGFMARSNALAHRQGLHLRPLRDTVADALRWEVEQGLDRVRSAGLTPAREAELLAELLTAPRH